jgi:hypothetical protein
MKFAHVSVDVDMYQVVILSRHSDSLVLLPRDGTQKVQRKLILSRHSDSLVLLPRDGAKRKKKTAQVNPLKTKRKLFYLKTQFVPRSKHFSSGLKNKSIYMV